MGGSVTACIPACCVVLFICVSVGRGCSPIADGGHLGPESLLIIKASYLSPVWCACGKFLSHAHHPVVLLVCRHLCLIIIVLVK